MRQAELVPALASSVLVLNRFYMAVHVVTARRALVLLYRELAEVVDLEGGRFANYNFDTWCKLSDLRAVEKAEHDDWIRTVSAEIQLPRVVRLHDYDKVPRRAVRFNRRNLFARDGNCCQYCGDSCPSNKLSFDHVVPRNRGGETNWENVVCACSRCNTKKGSRTPREAHMRLIRKPSKPNHSPLLANRMRNPKYEAWRSFLTNFHTAVDVC